MNLILCSYLCKELFSAQRLKCLGSQTDFSATPKILNPDHTRANPAAAAPRGRRRVEPGSLAGLGRRSGRPVRAADPTVTP
jgi:hypothetical protein